MFEILNLQGRVMNTTPVMPDPQKVKGFFVRDRETGEQWYSNGGIFEKLSHGNRVLTLDEFRSMVDIGPDYQFSFAALSPATARVLFPNAGYNAISNLGARRVTLRLEEPLLNAEKWVAGHSLTGGAVAAVDEQVGFCITALGTAPGSRNATHTWTGAEWSRLDDQEFDFVAPLGFLINEIVVRSTDIDYVYRVAGKAELEPA